MGGLDWRRSSSSSNSGGLGETALSHLLRSLSPSLDLALLRPYNPPRPAALPSPFLHDLTVDEKEGTDDEEDEEMEEGEDFSDASLSRLVALALRSPPSAALHKTPPALRGPPSVLQNPSSALNSPSSALRQRYQPQTSGKLRK